MANHNFDELYEQYPGSIAKMPKVFTSHEFILALAHQNQRLYIEALYSYKDYLHRGGNAPFQMVHSILSQRLSELPELVEHIGTEPSKDIFGQSNDCARWRQK